MKENDCYTEYEPGPGTDRLLQIQQRATRRMALRKLELAAEALQDWRLAIVRAGVITERTQAVLERIDVSLAELDLVLGSISEQVDD